MTTEDTARLAAIRQRVADCRNDASEYAWVGDVPWLLAQLDAAQERAEYLKIEYEAAMETIQQADRDRLELQERAERAEAICTLARRVADAELAYRAARRNGERDEALDRLHAAHDDLIAALAATDAPKQPAVSVLFDDYDDD